MHAYQASAKTLTCAAMAVMAAVSGPFNARIATQPFTAGIAVGRRRPSVVSRMPPVHLNAEGRAVSYLALIALPKPSGPGGQKAGGASR